MGRLNIWAVFAEVVNEPVVERAEVPREPNVRALVRGHVLVMLIDPYALQVVIDALVVAVYALPLIVIGVFVMEVASSLVASCLLHDVLINPCPPTVSLLDMVPLFASCVITMNLGNMSFDDLVRYVHSPRPLVHRHFQTP
jgi:hypothetical protein